MASGLVINLIDQRVRKLTPDFTSYTLAKAALWTLTQTAAQALAPAIRVNAIGPGPTLQGPRQAPEDFAAQRAATVLGRGASPDEIVAALGVFLEARASQGNCFVWMGDSTLAGKRRMFSGSNSLAPAASCALGARPSRKCYKFFNDISCLHMFIKISI